MNDAHNTERESSSSDKAGAQGLGAYVAEAFKLRQKPGPKKKDQSRSEKISCRLTKEEKAIALRYCKTHGLTEASLLRASYLAAVTQTPDEKIKDVAEAIARSADKSSPSIKEILKKSSIILLLTLLGCAAAPTIAKGVWFIYERGKSLAYTDHTACVYGSGTIGCQIVPR